MRCPRCGSEARFELLEEENAETEQWRVVCKCGRVGQYANTMAQAECLFKHPEYVEAD